MWTLRFCEIFVYKFMLSGPSKQAKQASIHMHMHNALSLVLDSLRFASNTAILRLAIYADLTQMCA